MLLGLEDAKRSGFVFALTVTKVVQLWAYTYRTAEALQFSRRLVATKRIRAKVGNRPISRVRAGSPEALRFTAAFCNHLTPARVGL